MTQNNAFGRGCRFTHRQIGADVVQSVRSDGHCSVLFDNGGTRWIHLDLLTDSATMLAPSVAEAAWSQCTFAPQAPDAAHCVVLTNSDTGAPVAWLGGDRRPVDQR